MGILDLFSASDPELVKKTLTRLAEQDTWNDVFSTKLIELLDKIDQIKSEIRDRLRSADERIKKSESVLQAESSLLEKAARFEDSSRRLDVAEAAEQRASALASDAHDKWQDATALLENAREMAEEARSQANNASKELHSAQEMQSIAMRLSRRTVHYAITAVALSWIAMGWIGWLVIHTTSTLWTAVSISVFAIVAAGITMKGIEREN